MVSSATLLALLLMGFTALGAARKVRSRPVDNLQHGLYARSKAEQIANSVRESFQNSFQDRNDASIMTQTASFLPPPCISNDSDVAYVNGMISATQTLYNCLANVADPGMIPSFYNGSYQETLVVNTSITLNNLERIDEVEGTARLQFSMRLIWFDHRLAMPNFWEKMSPSAQQFGIDLTDVIAVNDSIIMWQPLLRFPDASDITFQMQYFKLNASNVLVWAAGVDATLLQPSFNFDKYPWDQQDIVVRYVIFNMPTQFAVLGFNGGNSLLYNTYFDGTDTFVVNPIWQWKDTTYTTFQGNGYSYALYQITVQRKGAGIVLRLVLPITLLLLLAAMTFWILYENRVDTTITLLLSVSALYIVILGNIPLLGYLTDLDKFVFWMFLLLVLVVVIHQLYATLHQKREHWPLRPVFMRGLEMVGRVVLVPCIVVYFVTHVYSANSASGTSITIIVAVMIGSCTVMYREAFGFKKVLYIALEELIVKMNDPSTTVKDTSLVEVAVINYLAFGKISMSRELLSRLLKERGPIDEERFNSISTPLKNLSAFKDLQHGTSSTSTLNTTGGNVPDNASPTSGATRFSMGSNGVQMKELSAQYAPRNTTSTVNTTGGISRPPSISASAEPLPSTRPSARHSTTDIDSDDEGA